MKRTLTRMQRALVLIGILIIAGLLAFPLREMIFNAVVIPVAYITWNLGLLYRTFSQGILWWVLIFLVLLMLAVSLAVRPNFRPRTIVKTKPPQGQVEHFAVWIQRAEKGIYFKWLVANRLGRLAYQILLHRESGRPRSVFAPLLGADWEPRKELQQYLETGLHGSFADFPHAKKLSKPQHTPLDLDVVEAVEFLESQVENGRSVKQLGTKG
ncbi:MAG TPA: hypothetical protein VFY83_18170 [Anaerolineales bacterium]|nr:hypothetical protein [Anaerolineales bacterium]